MKGRKPNPTVIHIARGGVAPDGTPRTMGRRPLPDSEPVCTGDLTEPPDWMGESQKTIWRHVIATAPAGLLKNLDGSMLATWVVACDLHAQSSVMVQINGATEHNRFGEHIVSPHVRVMNNQATIMMRAAAEMGFSPTSRSRVTIDKKTPGNPFADLIGKKQG